MNNYLYVFPLLEKYHMKIVLSIIGKDTDDFTRIPSNNPDYSHVTWDQIREMLDSGYVEIQNHTYNLHAITHKRCGCMKNKGESLLSYEKILTEDIGRLQAEIKEKTGITPNTFAYPYGKVSNEATPILKRLGFQATLTCDFGVNVVTKDSESLYGLKRIARAHGASFQKLMREAVKTLQY